MEYKHPQNRHLKEALYNLDYDEIIRLGEEYPEQLERPLNVTIDGITLIPPIILAIFHNQLELVKVLMTLLVKKGVDANIYNFEGYKSTLIIEATRYGKWRIVEYLLSISGADVNAMDSNGKTALVWWCLENPTQNMYATGDLLVSTLINAGADPSIADTETGNIPLHLLVHQETNVVRSMIQVFPDGVHVRNRDGATPLVLAVRTPLDNARLLIEHGANVNALSLAYGRPLHAAASKGDGSQLKLLLSFGANPFALDDMGRTAHDIINMRGDDTLKRSCLSILEKVERRLMKFLNSRDLVKRRLAVMMSSQARLGEVSLLGTLDPHMVYRHIVNAGDGIAMSYTRLELSGMSERLAPIIKDAQNLRVFELDATYEGWGE